jgi:hypothetical protein
MKNGIIRTATLAACALGTQLPTTRSATAQDTGLQKLQLHGFLTQGYGRSSAEPIMGIGKEATADYRSAALQIRYHLATSDDLVLQVSHSRIGNSLLNEINAEVEMDWAFWQHRFGSVSTRIGKVPMPRGIYNEIRDVGTLLPFYRAPVNIYSEGYETIDGAVLAHSMDLGRWGLGTEVYAGSWKGIELDFDGEGEEGYEAELEEMRHTLATQLWLRTPIHGLRVGLAGARWLEVDLDDDDPPQKEAFILASVDGTFDRTMIRSEFRKSYGADSERREYYAQFGVRVTSAIAVNLQGEYATRRHDPLEEEDEESGPTIAIKPDRFTWSQDVALGINYSLSHNIVFKLEGHMAKGYNFERYIDTRSPWASTRYVISSFALSF